MLTTAGFAVAGAGAVHAQAQNAPGVPPNIPGMSAPIPPSVLPPADTCTLSLSNAQIDYGNLTRSGLLSGQSWRQPQVSLGKRELVLNVSCVHPRRMALVFQAPAADGDTFRFGEHGSMTLRLQAATLDGKPARLTAIPDSMAPGDSDEDRTMKPAQTMLIGGPAGNKPSRAMSVRVQVEARMPNDATRVSGEEAWEAQGRFELVDP